MTITLPIRTVSEANQREHWAAKAQRAKQQRSDTYLALRAARSAPPQAPYPVYGPLVATLTRIAPRDLDQGNLEASFKAVQDGVADWLAGGAGQGQDRQPGLLWRYRQARGEKRQYAVNIQIHADIMPRGHATWGDRWGGRLDDPK